MPEAASSSTAGAGWMAGVTAATLALLGVDYYALIGALGGVLFTLSSVREASSRARVLVTVAVTTFAAAVLGQGMAHVAGMESRPMLSVLSLICGAGGQVVVQAAVAALVARIQKLGGQ